jgi:hypothetical protein
MKANPHPVHDFSSQQILVAQKKDSGPEPCLADLYHSPVFMSQPEGAITQLYDRRMERHHQLFGLGLRDNQTTVKARIHIG